MMDYVQLTCRLPVARNRYTDDEQTTEYVVIEDCGASIDVVRHTGSDMDPDDGTNWGHYEWWEVTCQGGHTLLLPDSEGNDRWPAYDGPALLHELLDRHLAARTTRTI